MYKKTKIVATISDQRCDVALIRELFEAGMNVVRLNTAHQDTVGMQRVIDNVRAVSNHIAVLIDTKGPEVRTTTCESPISYHKGDLVEVVGDPDSLTVKERIAVSYPGFVDDLRVGAQILIDDGDLGMTVIAKDNGVLKCRIDNDALLKPRKSVNVPSVSIKLPALTDRDRRNIYFAIEAGVDFIAHSFVRSKEDVMEVRRLLKEKNSDIRIIAKIENQEGVDNIDEILEEADGIMVARGDLGIEVPQERIPGIQRRLVNKAIRAHKPVIVATQMLQSMIRNPRPTRTEVTDIANAVYSRTDALMLSGETAYGDYPVEAVKVMASVALQAEKDSLHDIGGFDVPLSAHPDVTEFFSKEAVMATQLMGLRAIIMDSFSGRTARYVSSFRGKCVTLAICYKETTVRHLALSYGVYALHMPTKTFGHEFLIAALHKLQEDGVLHGEDRICYLGSQRKEQRTSFMEMNIVRNLLDEEGKEVIRN
ncbi:pyruvate kinase [gut metagenome]|uniref:pyruvate kinase n=1 Tax=gut metagenome TaxID=749906 RepID=J9F2H4_9ZZZZ